MTMEITKPADNNSDGIGSVVKDLTHVIEKEVTAFQSLLDVLVEQQASIVKGDTDSVSLSNQEVEKIVTEAMKLERARLEKSVDISRSLNVKKQLSVSQIIPLVEERYANRLNELKNDLSVLTGKIQSTNKRNRYLLEHSLQFVNNCLRVLTQGQESVHSYSKKGKVEIKETSLYSGIG